jgi:hypothetical protein
VLTSIYSYPLILNIKTHIPYGYEGPTDGLFTIWNIVANINNFEKGDFLSLESNIFYPQRSVLSLNDRSVVNSIIAYPVYKLTDNRALMFNLIFFLIFILSGYGMFLVSYETTKDFFSSIIASTATNYIGFYFYPQNLYAISLEWVGFSIYFLYKFIKSGRTGYCFLSGFFFILNFLSTMYSGVFLTYTIAFFFLFFIYTYHLYYEFKYIKIFILTFTIAGAIIILFVLPYLKLGKSILNAVTEVDKIETSYTFLSFFSIKKETSYLWWKLTGGVLEKVNEWESFPGFVPFLFIVIFFKRKFSGVFKHNSKNLLYFMDMMVASVGIFILFLIFSDGLGIINIFPAYKNYNMLALLNYGFMFVFLYFILTILIIKSRRTRVISCLSLMDSLEKFFFCLFIISFVLSLGPFGGLYIICEKIFPGFSAVRAPHRFLKLGMVSMCVLIASSIKSSISGRYYRYAVFVILGFCILESLNIPIKLYKLKSAEELPQVYRWLAEQDDKTILELPIQKPEGSYTGIEEKRQYLLYQTQYMYYSTFHNKKMVNGYSSFIPDWYTKFLKVMTDFPDDVSLFIIKGMGIHYVIIHKDLLSEEEFNLIERKLNKYFEPNDVLIFGDDIILKIN